MKESEQKGNYPRNYSTQFKTSKINTNKNVAKGKIITVKMGCKNDLENFMATLWPLGGTYRYNLYISCYVMLMAGAKL